MFQPVNQPVDLEAVFPVRSPYPRPTGFRWQGRYYLVDEVHFVHERWSGAVRLLLYSVTADGSLVQLRYDGQRARWYVDGVYVEEG
ncbi:MAG: hypothetical protein ACP5G2_02330 [Candidatus Bipolaricaulaceae bacterium]